MCFFQWRTRTLMLKSYSEIGQRCERIRMVFPANGLQMLPVTPVVGLRFFILPVLVQCERQSSHALGNLHLSCLSLGGLLKCNLLLMDLNRGRITSQCLQD